MTFEEAVIYAAGWHFGQVDKSGEPFILHPLAVALAVPPRSRVVAVLHDLLEDTDAPREDVVRHLSPAELDALLLVTRPDGDGRPTYREFIEAIAVAPGEAGEIAREVKRADIGHNLGRLTPALAGMRARYERALARLDAVAQGTD